MSTKYFVSPDELRRSSIKMAAQILSSGFVPDFMIALWRGGASIGMYVHEFLKYKGHNVDHIAIRTSKYCGIDKAYEAVQVHNLSYPVAMLTPKTKLLIVDDIFDTGHSCTAVLKALKDECKDFLPESIKIATLFYKPTRNQSSITPDFYATETDRWVVFPHELEGLTEEEIMQHMGDDIGKLITEK